MGLTKKAKILLASIAAIIITVAVIIPLVMLSSRLSIKKEGLERLKNIDNSLQRSAKKILNLADNLEAASSRRFARDVGIADLRCATAI